MMTIWNDPIMVEVVIEAEAVTVAGCVIAIAAEIVTMVVAVIHGGAVNVVTVNPVEIAIVNIVTLFEMMPAMKSSIAMA